MSRFDQCARGKHDCRAWFVNRYGTLIRCQCACHNGTENGTIGVSKTAPFARTTEAASNPSIVMHNEKG